MARKQKLVLNKETGEYGTWVMSNHQPVFIADGETLEQAVKRLNKPKEYRQNTPYEYIDSEAKSADLDGDELHTLRSEVFRKNVAQGENFKPINYAYTANHFVVYATSGNDEYEIRQIFDMETSQDIINAIIKKMEKK